MFGSDVLEVGIGMALLFLFMSLIATAVRELAENLLKGRSHDLYRGISELLRDPAAADIVREFYEHPLIASLYGGDYKQGTVKNLPSYIPRESFALAALDLASGLKQGQQALSFDSLRVALESAPSPNRLQRVVLLAIKNAGGDYALAKKTIEEWFDATMDRVSGWYVRRTGKWLFLIGLSSAAAFNVDAITVAHRLITDKDLRQGVVQAAACPSTHCPAVSSTAGGQSTEVAPTLRELTTAFQAIGFPIGWEIRDNAFPYPKPQSCKPSPQTASTNNSQPAATSEASPAPPAAVVTCTHSRGNWLVTISGWLITAFAIMLGSPFWFDILNKFMSVRSTIKPKEKSPDEPPIDGAKTPSPRPSGGTTQRGGAADSPAANLPAPAGPGPGPAPATAMPTATDQFVPHEWSDHDPQRGLI
jgi:hypothetical protein